MDDFQEGKDTYEGGKDVDDDPKGISVDMSGDDLDYNPGGYPTNVGGRYVEDTQKEDPTYEGSGVWRTNEKSTRPTVELGKC